MAEGVVSFLLKKLSTLLSEEYTQLEGLKREIQYIRDELESMRGFLRNAEAKQDYGLLDAEQQTWIKQVREAAYDMEDAVDEFLFYFSHHIHGGNAGFLAKVGRMYKSVKNLRTRHRISWKIKDIKERVEQIAARHQRYQSSATQGIIAEMTTTTSHQHPIRGHALLLTEADLVGIDEPKNEIISLILNDNLHMKAISVVGMGGLGKTTLVKRVYESHLVKNAFSVHAWLTISQTLRIEVVLKDLIRQIHIPGDELDSMDADGLRAPVRNILKEKRYIIVLDDLWELEQWDSIKYVFPHDDNCGSCIVITTRNDDVADACCKHPRGNVGNLYKMRPLSTDESWNLFCRKTFGEDSCPPHLKSIANKILTKCGGLPLGIVTIGGLLALKDTNQWDVVLRSLGSELEGSGKLTPMTKILFLSYNELPYYLKSCLLYMGIFLEDEIIGIKRIAFLWIAEGFIEVRPGMTTMEVALSYLNELIRRNLIQVAETDPDGRLRCCRVHDLIREIVVSKCREHNILTPAFTPHTTWPENVRRLVVDDSTCPNNRFPLLHLRSLFVSTSPTTFTSLSTLVNGKIPKLVKVLDLRRAQTYQTTIPKQVFKLSNLIYLNLSNSSLSIFTHIPKSIGKLQNLEILGLGFNHATELPADIIKLKKLFYLNTGGLYSLKAPNELGRLFSLQYLKHIRVDSKEDMREIGKLTQLRDLGIEINFTTDNGRELCSTLQKLTNLQQLYIQIKENVYQQYSFSSSLQFLPFLHYLNLIGPFVKVPDWVTLCHGLTILTLIQSGFIEEDLLEPLADLPNLVVLTLTKDVYVGNTLSFKAGRFQKLKYLKLVGLTALELVILEEGTLSDLETLDLIMCNLMEEMPVGLQYLSKLRSLKLIDMSSRLENKLRNQKMDGHQDIAHITEILIENHINGEEKRERL